VTVLLILNSQALTFIASCSRRWSDSRQWHDKISGCWCCSNGELHRQWSRRSRGQPQNVNHIEGHVQLPNWPSKKGQIEKARLGGMRAGFEVPNALKPRRRSRRAVGKRISVLSNHHRMPWDLVVNVRPVRRRLLIENHRIWSSGRGWGEGWSNPWSRPASKACIATFCWW